MAMRSTPQSELSVASAVFYGAGALIALSVATVFRDDTSPLVVTNMIVSGIAVVIAVTALVMGRRFTTRPALLLICVSSALVLTLVAITPLQVRAMNSGLLYYTFIVYLAWFGPMWFARLAGYVWLAVYCGFMIAKWESDIHLFLLTLVLTSVSLGELVGTYKRRIELTSLTDPLCGVWNTRGFAGAMERAHRVARRAGHPLSAVFIDLDGLKQLNDVRGHEEGDRVLREFAAGITGASRPQDVIARLGGDEFVLLLPGTDLAQAELVAERLRGVVTVCDWSFGAAQLEPGETAEECLARADRQMLAQKRARKAGRGEG